MQKNTKKEGPLYPGTPQVGRSPGQTDPGSSATAHAEAGSLSQIREILVGPASQTFEQKLNQLEQSVDDKLARLNQEIKEERERQSKAAEQFKQECNSAVKAVRETVERFIKKCESSQAEFAAATRKKMEQLSTTLNGRLDTALGQLRSELVDRASLCSALSEAALRLSGAVHDVEIDPSKPDPEIDAALANLK